jgi:hypothetical protein
MKHAKRKLEEEEEDNQLSLDRPAGRKMYKTRLIHAISEGLDPCLQKVSFTDCAYIVSEYAMPTSSYESWCRNCQVGYASWGRMCYNCGGSERQRKLHLAIHNECLKTADATIESLFRNEIAKRMPTTDRFDGLTSYRLHQLLRLGLTRNRFLPTSQVARLLDMAMPVKLARKAVPSSTGSTAMYVLLTLCIPWTNDDEDTGCCIPQTFNDGMDGCSIAGALCLSFEHFKSFTATELQKWIADGPNSDRHRRYVRETVIREAPNRGYPTLPSIHQLLMCGVEVL